MLDLSSAFAKHDRAHFHLIEAQRIDSSFVEGKPYTLLKDVDSDGWHCLRIATLKTSYPQLALVLGDAANCMRATLDHIAFACVTENLDPKDEKAISFPITDTTQQFQSAMGALKKGLSPSALPLFEMFQPGPSPHFPDSRFLAILRDVNNRDKHRALSILIGLAKRAIFNPLNPSDIVEMEAFTPRPLEVGTILARFKLREGVNREDVQMQGKLTIVPIFEGSMPNTVAGESAITALAKAWNFINVEVLPAFDRINT